MLTLISFSYLLRNRQPLLQNIKIPVFQRLLRNTSAARLIEELGGSAVVREKITYKVKSLI